MLRLCDIVGVGEQMLDRAMEAGLNYIDTSWSSFNECSESFVGRALKKYQRDRFFLAAKLPLREVSHWEQAEAVFKKQLQYFHVKYIDYYLFHVAGRECWNSLINSGIIVWAEQQKEEGGIRHLGFSFHGGYELFREILTYRQWDFCQFQYNYMERKEQAGDRGYALAEKMGIPLIVMNPVRGGILADLPEEAGKYFKEANQEATVASWALRWVGSHSNVKVILSGMSTPDQVEDNLKTFQFFSPLDPEEKAIVERVAAVLEQMECAMEPVLGKDIALAGPERAVLPGNGDEAAQEPQERLSM